MIEAGTTYLLHGAGNADEFQVLASFEAGCADDFQGVGEVDGRERTGLKAITFYGLQGVGERDGSQACTTFEAAFQHLQGVGNHDGGQTGTTVEGSTS